MCVTRNKSPLNDKVYVLGLLIGSICFGAWQYNAFAAAWFFWLGFLATGLINDPRRFND